VLSDQENRTPLDEPAAGDGPRSDEGAPAAGDERLTDDREVDAPEPDTEDVAWEGRDPAEAGSDDPGAAEVLAPAGDTVQPGAEEAEDAGPRRPPLLVIVGSALMLVAIGVGLGWIIPSGPLREELLPTSAPLPTAPPMPEAIGEPDSTEPIVRVGDQTIPRGDFVRLYQPGANPDDLLNQLIMRELVVQAATSEGVEVDDAAVTAQVDQLKAQAGGDEQFASFIAENGLIDEANLRRLISRDLLIEQMVLRHTEAEQVHARHILLAAGEEEAETVATRKAEAEDLLQQLDGGADFAALAREHSDDSGSKEQGGDLGWAPRGAFVGPFDEAVFSMEVGERRLVQSQFGWHIIELIAAPEVRPFESMDLLNTQSGQEAFQTSFLPWADKLKADAEAANRIEVLVQSGDLVSDPAQS